MELLHRVQVIFFQGCTESKGLSKKCSLAFVNYNLILYPSIYITKFIFHREILDYFYSALLFLVFSFLDFYKQCTQVGHTVSKQGTALVLRDVLAEAQIMQGG